MAANFPVLIYQARNNALWRDFEDVSYREDYLFWFCMGLKTLRLHNVKQVAEVPKRIIHILGEIFYMKRYMLQNLLSWLLASQKFLMSVHYFACGWIFIHELKYRWGFPAIVFRETEPFAMYFESFYLMTTTISTVGYGDYKGFNGSKGE